MTMVDTSIFSRTARVFENVRNSSLRTHSIENPSISMIVRTSSRLFQMLDRSDPAQTEISRRLWVLRSSILFTLLPFDDSALNLREQVMQLAAASRGLPDANSLLESLTSEVMNIVTTGRNPKMEIELPARATDQLLNDERDSQRFAVHVLLLSARRTKIELSPSHIIV